MAGDDLRTAENLRAWLVLDLSMIRPAGLSDELFVEFVRGLVESSIVNRHSIIVGRCMRLDILKTGGERWPAGGLTDGFKSV